MADGKKPYWVLSSDGKERERVWLDGGDLEIVRGKTANLDSRLFGATISPAEEESAPSSALGTGTMTDIEKRALTYGLADLESRTAGMGSVGALLALEAAGGGQDKPAAPKGNITGQPRTEGRGVDAPVMPERTAIQEGQLLAEQYPVENFAGNLTGYFGPGAFNALVGGAKKAVGKGAGRVAAALSLGGAATTENAARQISEAAGELLENRYPEQSVGSIGGQLAASGLAAGLGGFLMPGSIGMRRGSVMEGVPFVGTGPLQKPEVKLAMEAAGGQPKMLGWQEGEQAKRILGMQTGEMPLDIASREAEPAFLEAARSMSRKAGEAVDEPMLSQVGGLVSKPRQGLEEGIIQGGEKHALAVREAGRAREAAYFNSPEGKAYRPQDELVETTLDILRKGKYSAEGLTNEGLPLARNTEFVRVLDDIADVRVPLNEEWLGGPASEPGAIQVGIDDARRIYGHARVKSILEEASKAEGIPEEALDLTVLEIVPRPVNYEELERVIGIFTEAADAAGKKRDPLYAREMASLMSSREGYAANRAAPPTETATLRGGESISGPAAMSRNVGQTYKGAKDLRQTVGLTRDVETDVGPNELLALQSRLGTYPSAAAPQQTAALERLASEGDVAGQLREYGANRQQLQALGIDEATAVGTGPSEAAARRQAIQKGVTGYQTSRSTPEQDRVVEWLAEKAGVRPGLSSMPETTRTLETLGQAPRMGAERTAAEAGGLQSAVRGESKEGQRQVRDAINRLAQEDPAAMKALQSLREVHGDLFMKGLVSKEDASNRFIATGGSFHPFFSMGVRSRTALSSQALENWVNAHPTIKTILKGLRHAAPRVAVAKAENMTSEDTMNLETILKELESLESGKEMEK